MDQAETTNRDPSRETSEYPENPVVVRVRRGGATESIHRGAWCLVDTTGGVLAGAGEFDRGVFVRSAIKSIQALPLFESGAAKRFGFSAEELTLALASHSGEACHTERIAATLARLGLDEAALQCGTHPPNDPAVRKELRSLGRKPSPLHNNCSGKHTGFLALAKHLGVPLESYLDPDSAGQVLVRDALAELTGTARDELEPAIDGCSAPTYRVTLRGLATAFARISNPDGLGDERRAHCRQMTTAVAAHPELLAGRHRRIDTDIARVSGGRLFPKIGAEGVYAIGVCGGERALAVKIDDGGLRGLHTLVVALCEHLGLVTDSDQLNQLATWRDPVLRNYSGLEIGTIEAVLA